MVLPASPAGSTRRATVVGTGLIGGSIGMALGTRGWHVSGIAITDVGLLDAIIDQAEVPIEEPPEVVQPSLFLDS